MSAPADPTKPGVQITASGIDVADGTLVRATLGLLPDGTYGLGMFDQYGSNLLNVEGFGPSWAALIQSGVYNNVFSQAIGSIYYSAAIRSLWTFSTTIAYFRLGEPSGTTATDSSPTANNGTYFNAPTLGVPGALINDPDTAVTFVAASTQYMEAASNVNYAVGAQSYTLTIWFKIAAYPVANQYLINMNTATTNGFEMFIDSNGLLNSRIGAATVQSAAVPLDGQWHFAAVVMSRLGGSQTGQYYIDGTPSGASVDISGAAAQNIVAAALSFARLTAGTNYFDGSLDEAALISNVALTASQVEDLYLTGVSTATGQTTLPLGTSGDDTTGLTSSLPFWTVWAASGTGTATVVAEQNYPGGNALAFTYSGTGSVSSNNVAATSAMFPIESLMAYRVVYAEAIYAPGSVVLNTTVTFLWYDAQGGFISSRVDSTGGLSGGYGPMDFPFAGAGYSVAPLNARFARIEINNFETVAHSAQSFTILGEVSVVPVYDQQVITGVVQAGSVFTSFLSTDGAGAADIGAAFSLTNSISPALTGNTNDWNPTGLLGASGIYVAPTAVWHITGLSATGADANTGRIIYIYNNSAFDLFLDTFSGSSAAANIFIAPSQVRIPSAGTVWLVRAQANGGWLVLPGTGTIPAVRSFYLPAAVATADSGTKTTIGATAQLVPVVALADAATQGCYWSFETPADFLSGDFTAQVVWAAGSTDANATHTVRWTYNALKFVQNTSAIAGTVATTFTGAATARTANFSYYDTGTLMGLAPVVNTPNRFEAQRIGADAADTYVGVVNVIGIIVTYLAKA